MRISLPKNMHKPQSLKLLCLRLHCPSRPSQRIARHLHHLSRISTATEMPPSLNYLSKVFLPHQPRWERSTGVKYQVGKCCRETRIICGQRTQKLIRILPSPWTGAPWKGCFVYQMIKTTQLRLQNRNPWTCCRMKTHGWVRSENLTRFVFDYFVPRTSDI